MVRPPDPRLTRAGSPARGRTAGAAAALLVLTVALGLPPRLDGAWGGPRYALVFLAVAWGAFALGAWWVSGLPRRTAVVLVLLGAVALPLVASYGPPRSSDDLYRYLWDGRVQAAGLDPYRYPPAATELAGLRDDGLWPADGPWCVDPGPGVTPGCTRINRPTVPTIYPPVAEAVFWTLGPGRAGVLGIQLLATALALATTGALLFGLRVLGGDPRRAVLWAWCPTVAIEVGSNAHIDVLAALCTVSSLLVLARARSVRATGAGGLLLGLGIASKLTPGLVLPAVLRRRPVTLLASVAGAVVAVYAPHVLAVGLGVLGYTPGYLREEGFANGSRFALLTTVLPTAWAAPVAVVILATVAFAVARTSDPDRPWLGATVMVGTAMLVAAPSYPWYAVLLVALVGLGGGARWLVVAAAGYVAQYAASPYLVAPDTAQRLGYGAAVVVLLTVLFLRTRRAAEAAA